MRAGDTKSLRDVMAMFLNKPVDPAVLERLGDEAARAARTALDETLKVCMYESSE